MDKTSVSSFFVALLFILRCLIPIALLLGVSYLMRKLGLVVTEEPEPTDEELEAAEQGEDAQEPKES